MALNGNPQFGSSARYERASSESASELDTFSSEQLAAMSKVLIALLRATSIMELLENTHSAMRDVAQVSACAHYVAMRHGDLRIDCGAGGFRECLPDVIPSGSDLFLSIRSSDFVTPVDATFLQPSLFDDTPAASFWAVGVNGEFAGAFACVHESKSEEFVNAVCRQVVVSVDTLYKLPIGGSPGVVAATAAEDTRETSTSCRLTDCLTSREKEILALVGNGMGNKEIATKLFISVSTCKHHLENIFSKLGVHNRSAAVSVGRGLRSPGS